jgi:hypothetical protein
VRPPDIGAPKAKGWSKTGSGARPFASEGSLPTVDHIPELAEIPSPPGWAEKYAFSSGAMMTWNFAGEHWRRSEARTGLLPTPGPGTCRNKGAAML